MKTKKYLERLLKDDEALRDAAHFSYRRVEFDAAEAVKFSEGMALSVLIKLNRLARTFKQFYEEDNCRPVMSLGILWRRWRLLKCYNFWCCVDTEVSKIRTRRLLTALTRDGVGHIRRNYLNFHKEAAKEFYSGLDDGQRLSLLNNVRRKEKNAFKVYNEMRDKTTLDPDKIAKYKEGAMFWSDVMYILSHIEVETAA